MAAFVECFDPLDDLVAGDRDHERQQRLQQRDDADGRRKELLRVHRNHEAVVGFEDDRAGGAIGQGDDFHALLARDGHGLHHFGAIRLACQCD